MRRSGIGHVCSSSDGQPDTNLQDRTDCQHAASAVNDIATHSRNVVAISLTFGGSGGNLRDQKRASAGGPRRTEPDRIRGAAVLARQRQAYILDRVREDGGVRVADLVRELSVRT